MLGAKEETVVLGMVWGRTEERGFWKAGEGLSRGLGTVSFPLTDASVASGLFFSRESGQLVGSALDQQGLQLCGYTCVHV